MKKNNFLIGVIGILILIIIFLIAFIINDKVLSNKEDNNVNLLTNEEAIELGKKLYDKVTEIYEVSLLTPYCGKSKDVVISENDIEILGNSAYGNGNYFRTTFSSLDDLKKYLTSWLSDDLINNLVVKTKNVNDKKYYKYVEDLSLLNSEEEQYSYVDYVLKDNTLYCRLDTGKDYFTQYDDEYKIKVSNILEDRIEYIITSTYIKTSDNISTSLDNEVKKEYKDTTFIIEKNTSGNFVVVNYTLHD